MQARSSCQLLLFNATSQTKGRHTREAVRKVRPNQTNQAFFLLCLPCLALLLPQWAEGDELLVNTEERSACAMESLASLPLKGDEDPEAIYKMLRDVLLKDPVYNSQTIYSLIMVPSDMHVVKVA